MTSTDLILSIWNRRREDWTALMSVKQVGFFLDLLRRENQLPPTSQRCYPIYGIHDGPPLEVAVYPNGAGFVRVQQWAITPDRSVASKWRLKTGAELSLERSCR